MALINWVDAITEMRKLSAEKVPFEFTYSTFDSKMSKSNGLVKVKKAILRKSIPESAFKNANADSFLAYTDIETDELKICNKFLIVEFNGNEVVLQ